MPVYVMYFQGNASSIPPRLPLLSPLLKTLKAHSSPIPIRYIMVCVSYRGYWKSKGRATETGILKDATAALHWVSRQERDLSTRLGKRIPVIVWGQSIGAGVASNLVASQQPTAENVDVRLLILETPFTSIRDMLVALYPQKWLPYRRLWPFLRNHLDSKIALSQIAQRPVSSLPRIVILQAGRDELVPESHSDILERICLEKGLCVQRHVIDKALHNEVMYRPGGRTIVGKVIRDVAERETSMSKSTECEAAE